MRARLSLLLTPALLVTSLLLALPVRADVLELVDVQRDDHGAADGLSGVTAVVASRDGRHVYATGQSEDAVAAFARDAASGALTLVEVARNGSDGVEGLARPVNLALSPDGAHLYVASSQANGVVVFSRDRETGRLTFVEAQQEGAGGVEGLLFTSAVAVSPDGEHVYASGQRSSAIVVFGREASTGQLTYLETVRDGSDGVDGIAGVVSLALSRDGKSLYAAGMDDNAVAVFRRAGNGSLAFLEAVQDAPTSPRYGLVGAAEVTVSPDGAFVYATGLGSDALATFARSKSNGRLRFVGVTVQGSDDVDGLLGAHSVAVSPDGTRLYATGLHAGTVAVFDRDPETGELVFAEVHQNMTGPNTCLAFARGVTVSPSGRDVYVAGSSSNAINVFRVRE